MVESFLTQLSCGFDPGANLGSIDAVITRSNLRTVLVSPWEHLHGDRRW